MRHQRQRRGIYLRRWIACEARFSRGVTSANHRALHPDTKEFPDDWRAARSAPSRPPLALIPSARIVPSVTGFRVGFWRSRYPHRHPRQRLIPSDQFEDTLRDAVGATSSEDWITLSFDPH